MVNGYMFFPEFGVSFSSLSVVSVQRCFLLMLSLSLNRGATDNDFVSCCDGQFFLDLLGSLET